MTCEWHLYDGFALGIWMQFDPITIGIDIGPFALVLELSK